LHQWADEFAKRRSDVGNAGLSFGSRGLGEDEAAAFGARWAFQAERDGNALYFTELHNTALANAAETSPSIEDAYALARATEIDGEQRAYPYQWGSEDELTEFVEQLKSRLSEGDLSHTRPWRWFAKTSGGNPLTAVGKECGLELRFSWYQ